MSLFPPASLYSLPFHLFLLLFLLSCRTEALSSFFSSQHLGTFLGDSSLPDFAEPQGLFRELGTYSLTESSQRLFSLRKFKFKRDATSPSQLSNDGNLIGESENTLHRKSYSKSPVTSTSKADDVSLVFPLLTSPNPFPFLTFSTGTEPGQVQCIPLSFTTAFSFKPLSSFSPTRLVYDSADGDFVTPMFEFSLFSPRAEPKRSVRETDPVSENLVGTSARFGNSVQSGNVKEKQGVDSYQLSLFGSFLSFLSKNKERTEEYEHASRSVLRNLAIRFSSCRSSEGAENLCVSLITPTGLNDAKHPSQSTDRLTSSEASTRSAPIRTAVGLESSPQLLVRIDYFAPDMNLTVSLLTGRQGTSRSTEKVIAWFSVDLCSILLPELTSFSSAHSSTSSSSTLLFPPSPPLSLFYAGFNDEQCSSQCDENAPRVEVLTWHFWWSGIPKGLGESAFEVASPLFALPSGSALLPNRILLSLNRKYYLSLSATGRLTVRRSKDDEVIWASTTQDDVRTAYRQSCPSASALLRADGRFVVQCGDRNVIWESPAASSASRQNSHYYVTVDNEGSVSVSQSSGSETGSRKEEVVWSTRNLSHHSGSVLHEPIRVYLIWYGNWEKQSGAQEMVRNFVTSISVPNDQHEGIKQNGGGVRTVSEWWENLSQYVDSKGRSVTREVLLAGECSDGYSEGREIVDETEGGSEFSNSSPLSPRSTPIKSATSIVLNALRTGEISSRPVSFSDAIFVVLPSPDVVVNGLCGHSSHGGGCAARQTTVVQHDATLNMPNRHSDGDARSVNYLSESSEDFVALRVAVVPHMGKNCPQACVPSPDPSWEEIVPSNRLELVSAQLNRLEADAYDLADDALVNTLAHELAEFAANPDHDGWFRTEPITNRQFPNHRRSDATVGVADACVWHFAEVRANRGEALSGKGDLLDGFRSGKGLAGEEGRGEGTAHSSPLPTGKEWRRGALWYNLEGIDGHKFLVQSLWSNRDGKCVPSTSPFAVTSDAS